MEKRNKQDEEKIIVKDAGNVSTLNPSQAQHEIDENKNDMRAKQEKEKIEDQDREIDAKKAKDILIDPAERSSSRKISLNGSA